MTGPYARHPVYVQKDGNDAPCSDVGRLLEACMNMPPGSFVDASALDGWVFTIDQRGLPMAVRVPGARRNPHRAPTIPA